MVLPMWRPHLAPASKFKNAECLYCKKKGHLARVCKAKARRKQPSQPVAHYMEEQDSLEEDIFTICDQKCSPIVIDILLNDVPVQMEVDHYGNQPSDIPTHPAANLRPSKVRLKTYTGHAIPIEGCATLRIQARHDKQQSDVVIQMVTEDGPNLLGKDMLQKLEALFTQQCYINQHL